MLRIAKGPIDEHLPWAARRARMIRDWLKAALRRGYRTDLGFVFHGDRGIDTSRAASGEYARFVAALAEADLVVDVGANAGFFTAVAALAGRRVIAIEPDPLNLRALYRCLRDNALDAEVFPIALSDRAAILPLFGGGQGASLLEHWGRIRSPYSRLVPANTLDNLLAGRAQGERLLIKLDVEGAEYRVLEGAAATLARSPAPVWIVEHGLHENFEDRNPWYMPLFEKFWAAGYEALAIEENARRIDRAEVEAWCAGLQAPKGMYYEFRRAAPERG
jgi:FkbM family methyltransferase